MKTNKLLLALSLGIVYILGYDTGRKEEKEKNDLKWKEVKDQIDDVRDEFRRSHGIE